jgi:hypothetical protein
MGHSPQEVHSDHDSFNHEWMMAEVKPLTMAALEAGLDTIRQSPNDAGVVALIVRRPQMGARKS